ncbi:hypothetical protein QR680_012734 [Steinernema hermaphroditum]|uniref:Uncharacterized protein n=1 Tax=Steinernema hermaphroditum TaxID=289476 RepID=A0AA39M115_9BILA|nr:hypothetical protein QR680_012734 [Steinernema hermaphroditum]
MGLAPVRICRTRRCTPQLPVGIATSPTKTTTRAVPTIDRHLSNDLVRLFAAPHYNAPQKADFEAVSRSLVAAPAQVRNKARRMF